MIRSGVFLSAALLCLPSLSQATTWHVPSQCPTIQTGIDSASTGDTVLVACGTYYEHDIVMKSGVSLHSETDGVGCVTVDAQLQGRILDCQGLAETAEVDGFTLIGGLAENGGAVYCDSSSLVLSRCRFQANGCEHRGGAIYCTFSSFAAEACTVAYNRAWEPGGGGYFRESSVRLESCVVIGNEAGFYGGGICCDSATIVNCRFSQNSAYVGDIFDGSGGGIYCGRSSITDCVFSENSACFVGGGLACGNAAITRCIFFGNQSWCGGGGVACGEGVRFTNCTFFGNDAYWSGAAVYIGSYCDKKAGEKYLGAREVSSGLRSISYPSDSAPVFMNCVLASNTSAEAVSRSPSTWVPAPTFTCCDIYGNDGGDWVGCIAGQDSVRDNFSWDPLFCDPDNGDFSIADTSPCAAENNPSCGLVGALGVGCTLPPERITVTSPNGGELWLAGSQQRITWTSAWIGSVSVEYGDGQTWTKIEAATPAASGSYRWTVSDNPGQWLVRVCSVAGGVCDESDSAFTIRGPLVWRVPMDAPTIQAGIDSAAAGDTVLVADGTYSGFGNRDIDFNGKAITLRSESGDPSTCILDCEGLGRGFYFHSGEDSASVLNGVTVTNAFSSKPGGGVCCDSVSAPMITGCVISRSVGSYGGAIACLIGSCPGIMSCSIVGDSATVEGGGLYCAGSSSPTLDRTIIAFCGSGQAIYCDGTSGASLRCCNLNGNAGGDWVGCTADQYGVNGNISEDPLFCNPDGRDFHLDENSPCAPANAGACGLIGALGTACANPPPELALGVFQNPYLLTLA